MSIEDIVAPVTLTPAAIARIAALVQKLNRPVAGVRLSAPKEGCSGFSYKIDYVEAPDAGDIEIRLDGVTLFVDRSSLDRIQGTVMDWQDNDFAPGFVFRNPNAHGTCGCGESFTF